MAKDPAPNTLYYGDNLDVLRRHIKDETVDLVYLDPPFNSAQDYNVLFAEKSGERSAAQIRAFEDTWCWDQGAAAAYQEVVEQGGRVADAMLAFRTFLGESDMMAYLAMMAPRFVELRRVLKPTGSIYLHCDPTASHYLKMLMDAVFGHARCVNEIIWHYYNKMQGNIAHFPENHDTIFWYSKDDCFRFNVLKEKRDKTIRQLKRVWDPEKKSIVNAKGADGKCLYIETDERRIDDVWRLSMLQPAGREMLGYPTQKPETVLERIIRASSNEGDVVLDPFCGCGTAIAVAQRLKRRWIGIDITHLAITLIKHRLVDAFGDGEMKADFRVVGEPTDLPGARALADSDPYQFQWWALGLVGARPTEQKKGADKGIDGRIYFHDEASGRGGTRQVILSVKAGDLKATYVRDLVGVVAREKAEIGVLLCMDEPTRPMRTEAAATDLYVSPWGTKHPRIQILTIENLLDGKRIDMPPIRQTSQTYKSAPRAASLAADRQGDLPGLGDSGGDLSADRDAEVPDGDEPTSATGRGAGRRKRRRPS